MDDKSLDAEELARITTSLHALCAHLEEDLHQVRQLPEGQLAELLRQQSQASRYRAEVLRMRLTELREVIDARRRTLERLRARMYQIRGGAKPH
jgi:hypothetical protein